MAASRVMAKLIKLSSLLSRRDFAVGLLKHRVAATVEHLEAIRFAAPKTLLDVGANVGQFSLAVRSMFPLAQIHAFEPLPSACERYAALFRGDELTQLHKVAISDAADDCLEFHVTDRNDSSSILRPAKAQTAAFGVRESHTIKVQAKPLHDVVELTKLARPVLLKIDVQGAELQVLRGVNDWNSIDTIYIESSFVELYEGQSLFADVNTFLVGNGFQLRGVYNQTKTDAFGPTQADFLFLRAR